MAELLPFLPTELNSKIFLYLSHPIGDIVKENISDFENNNLIKDFIFYNSIFQI